MAECSGRATRGKDDVNPNTPDRLSGSVPICDPQ